MSVSNAFLVVISVFRKPVVLYNFLIAPVVYNHYMCDSAFISCMSLTIQSRVMLPFRDLHQATRNIRILCQWHEKCVQYNLELMRITKPK